MKQELSRKTGNRHTMDYRTTEQMPLDELREIHRRRLRRESNRMIAWCHRMSDEYTEFLTAETLKGIITERETREDQLVLAL